MKRVETCMQNKWAASCLKTLFINFYSAGRVNQPKSTLLVTRLTIVFHCLFFLIIITFVCPLENFIIDTSGLNCYYRKGALSCWLVDNREFGN